MPLLARGQSSDGNRPVLDLFTPTIDPFAEIDALCDVAALAFQVLDVSDHDKRANPVQVYPATAGDRAPVNIADLWPAGDKLAVGHYVARWTAPATENIGLHEIRWYVTATAGAPEQMLSEQFDVVAEGVPSSPTGYALVSDLREEGVTLAEAHDTRIARLILFASQYIERVTGRFFEPRPMTLLVDGSGGRIQLLGHPIIAINSVKMYVGMYAEFGTLPVIPSFFRIYNRHLTAGLLDPDDREDPRLEFFHWSDLLGVHSTPAGHLGLGSLVWLPGVQNVIIDGLFGYTDPDGTAIGRTPELIRHVTKLLVLRELPRMTDLTRREDAQKRWRLTSERTRDQGYNLEANRLYGSFTGDPEIDNILVTFQRPAQFGGA
jgi:hypothetical protein